MDASDPFDLILNPTPEDETIRESGDTVVYKPFWSSVGVPPSTRT